MVTKDILENFGSPHAIIDSKECVTARHLLERAAAACRQQIHKSLGTSVASGFYPRCETVNALENQLEKTLKDAPRFTLVFDGVDQQKEAPPSLLPGLIRLGSIVSSQHL